MWINQYRQGVIKEYDKKIGIRYFTFYIISYELSGVERQIVVKYKVCEHGMFILWEQREIEKYED